MVGIRGFLWSIHVILSAAKDLDAAETPPDSLLRSE